MFKLPVSVYINVLHGFACKMLAQKPDGINIMVEKVMKWAEKEHISDPETSMLIPAALYLAAMHMVEIGIDSNVEHAPDEVKRAMAMFSLLATNSSDTSGEIH